MYWFVLLGKKELYFWLESGLKSKIYKAFWQEKICTVFWTNIALQKNKYVLNFFPGGQPLLGKKKLGVREIALKITNNP